MYFALILFEHFSRWITCSGFTVITWLCQGKNILDNYELMIICSPCILMQYVIILLSHIEAEHAINMKKRIIPLKYENHKPTGWLGLLIGSLKYHDVRSDEALEKSFDFIVKDIRGESLPATSSGKAISRQCCQKLRVQTAANFIRGRGK